MNQHCIQNASGARRKTIGLILGLAAFLIMIISPRPADLSGPSWHVAAIAVLMAVWWMTEAVPLSVTALLPIVILPLIGLKSFDQIAASYAHPLIFLFLGGFLIAKSIERWGLHRRIAARIVQLAPPNPAGMVGALMLATAFLSMWISNTATAMVMVPIAQAVIHSSRMERQPGAAVKDGIQDTFAAPLMLAIAFSSTIGGMASLIGTPPNALLAGYLQTSHGITIGFGQWMLLGVPVMLALLPICWLLLTRVVFNLSADDQPDTFFKVKLEDGEKTLPLGAKFAAAIISCAGIFLVLRPLIQTIVPSIPLTDAGIVMTAALILFITPAWDGKNGKLLHWGDVQTIRWDVLILFGGGLALADAIDTSGLSKAIGLGFANLNAWPTALVILIAMVVIVYLGELASNTAMAAVFLPIAGAAAVGLGVAPLQFIIPIGLAASLGFMLPVATPPNAIVYGSGEVSSGQMLKAGAGLDILSIFIVYGLTLVLTPMIF